MQVEECIWRDSKCSYIRRLPELMSVHHRSISSRLQRALCDFGFEHSFAQAALRVREHYGFEINKSAVARQSVRHACAIREMQDNRGPVGALPAKGADVLSVQSDGTMLRVATCGKDRKGKRLRKVEYREVRLCAAKRKGSATIAYEAGLRDVTGTGRLMGLVAKAGGWGLNSHVHAVGDGAEWIRLQVRSVFGEKSRYLIDLFHLCEYLAEAGETCSKTPQRWLKEQKDRLICGHAQKVMKTLKKHLEAETMSEEQAPVRCAYRYMSNREGCFFYDLAIEQELEIGSGMIEGGHKQVLQARLKLPGASWGEDTLDAFAQARAFRANGLWDSYWKRMRAA